MNRYVSFGLLITVILITGFVFYKVMAGFFLPLFLAALLVVLFRPLHNWFLNRCQNREKLAAFLTTASILLIVLLPFTITMIFAGFEARTVIRKLDSATIMDKLLTTRSKLGLDMPLAADFERIDQEIKGIKEETVEASVEKRRQQIDFNVTALRSLAEQLNDALVKNGYPFEWREQLPESADSANPGKANETDATDSADERKNESGSPPTGQTSGFESPYQGSWTEFAQRLARARRLLSENEWSKLNGDADDQQKQLTEAREIFNDSIDRYYDFKTGFLGGPIKSWLKELANPNPDELNDLVQKGSSWLRDKAVTFGSTTTAFLVQFLFGVTIMSIALFSFLLDGPAMLRGLKRMTPLDDEHEDELIAEFDKVSRAVVMATLLSALAQGVLAAIGFYFAGLDAVILLMLLTCVLALVPFVGAAAVWVPASLWLIFVEGSLGWGIFLAVYGMVVVSMADNVIKPFILHGQSNLHPLWALLSVLGGVSALGPVGILIGPMVVVFLQTLLNILQKEIESMDRQTGSPSDSSVST